MNVRKPLTGKQKRQHHITVNRTTNAADIDDYLIEVEKVHGHAEAEQQRLFFESGEWFMRWSGGRMVVFRTRKGE